MIELAGLTKRYGLKTAVRELTCVIRPGQVTGFLGPNGAGKSTTMRMILGLDHPTAGRALVEGRPYARLTDPLTVVGALLEARAVHPGRTAFHHLLCLAQSNGIPRRRVGQVLDLVGLGEVGAKRPKGFSLGMGQRLGIASALLGDPRILIFDEPVNGLDPEGIHWVRNLLRRLAAEGRTVFVSSHLMSEMALTADHLIVIGQGQLLADTSMAGFIEENARSYTRVSSPDRERLLDALNSAGLAATPASGPGADGALDLEGDQTVAVGELAAERRLVLHELCHHRASLEEAFMRLTRQAVEYQARDGAEDRRGAGSRQGWEG
ncbi:ATP-binding cassette domain-containing protein [Streptomyces triticirhizae]|uniref:ATP-binding cassette domain-containing protein n=1 Tax=Streptomyces triticirhizae TaxID=2483353 RepID=A0A3M2LP79_9ACTN|nr:ATP-binding cassette domain-containing protein [Streptomyces triticirhizae]RMI38690.1 ATP-binding cassette domain-containing protein [Streptomyces triticirhizae]